MRSYLQSSNWLERARKITPGAAQTMSKSPYRFPVPAHPSFLVRGEGSHVWDYDGNEFIDHILSLAAVTLGYNHESVQCAVVKALTEYGSNLFSLPHPLEAMVAERVCSIFPCGRNGSVRFVVSGSEADAGVVRIARRATGRDVVACCGYLGWHDWTMVRAPQHPGVPEAMASLVRNFNYGEIPVFDDLAAIFIEPPLFPPPGLNVKLYLETLLLSAHAHGALLIFDEVVCGGRFALGGGQEYFGVTPDLATFGKGLANSYPLAGIVGPRDLMKYADVVSGTFAGGIVPLAACNATLDVYGREPVIEHLWKVGTAFTDGLQDLIVKYNLPAMMEGYGLHPRLYWRKTFWPEGMEDGPNLLMSLFLQETAERGVLLHPGGWNVSYAHTEQDLAESLAACDAAFEICAEALADGKIRERLRGEPIQEGFLVRA